MTILYCPVPVSLVIQVHSPEEGNSFLGRTT